MSGVRHVDTTGLIGGVGADDCLGQALSKKVVELGVGGFDQYQLDTVEASSILPETEGDHMLTGGQINENGAALTPVPD